MSDMDAIHELLAGATRRRRRQRAANGLWKGVLAGALVWLAAVVIYKLAPVPALVLFGAAGLAALCAIGGLFSGWMRPPTMQQTARCLDLRQDLQERISTALEIGAAGPSAGWRALLLGDAARVAAKLDPRKVFPYRLPPASSWALGALALAAGLGFVPEYRSKQYLDRKADAAAIQEAGKRIVQATRQTLEHRPPALQPTRQALESVQQLGLHLDKATLTRNDALKDVANVADKLKAQLQDLQKKNPEFKALERAARQPDAGANTADQKQLDDLQKSLGKAGENPAALDKLADQLQKLQKAAAGLPQGNTPEAAAERQKLAQNLQDLADQARQLGQPLPNLDDAIAALQASQTDVFQKDMDLATTDLAKTQALSKELQRLQAQAERQGKDLPEQLKFGQIDAARQTLEKMVDNLRSGKITPEQLSRLLDEVSRSVAPAAPYGDAAADLHRAEQQLRGGDKSAAAESLAAAASELEKIQGQLADAKDLQGALDALSKAELCIASHCRWGECAAAGKCLGLGQGPGGRGVGTWTDDDSQLYPQMSGLWDNSDIDRPDRDPRGLTDRGKPQLADNLAPTKLHGQITPGAPMPAITLKGISIKGQSSVAYQEAVSAAQSDARSALNQDEVPRAYQGAVRDYFDDLKN
ncbi:MAG: hypothetical protein ABSG59_19670 [Verrucomicrobiota bacterium]|jgi:hypothetical protein